MPELPDAELTPAERRVADALVAHALPARVIVLDQLATTAQMAAEALQVEVGQIVKSLVFRGAETGAPYLLLVSGANRVHEKRTGRQIGEKLERADADLVKSATGFSIGGVSPLGHAQTLRIFMDEALFIHEVVWAAAGHPRSVFAISPDDLARVTNATRLSVV